MEKTLYEKKWAYLDTYQGMKKRMIRLKAERDEYRDLKRLADDIGIPPEGMIGDPTGNAAAKLCDRLERIEFDLERTLSMMESVNRFISRSNLKESEQLVLVLKFIRGKTLDEIAEDVGASSRSAVKKRLRRIVQRLEPPDGFQF